MPQIVLDNGGGYGYWLASRNDFSADTAGQTIALVAHEVLDPNLTFSLTNGSGLRDVYQNCFLPCAGPGCVRRDTGVPGQYTVEPGQWLPNNEAYPTCDLIDAGVSRAGDFNLSFADENGFQQRDIAAFQFTETVEEFYGETGADFSGWGLPFNAMQAPQRTVAFLYREELTDSYYLVIAHSSQQSTVSGSITMDITGVSTDDIVLRDDASDTYEASGNGISVTHIFSPENTDGVVINLGDTLENIQIELDVDESEGIDEFIYFYPGGSAILDSDETITITGVAQQAAEE